MLLYSQYVYGFCIFLPNDNSAICRLLWYQVKAFDYDIGKQISYRLLSVWCSCPGLYIPYVHIHVSWIYTNEPDTSKSRGGLAGSMHGSCETLPGCSWLVLSGVLLCHIHMHPVPIQRQGHQLQVACTACQPCKTDWSVATLPIKFVSLGAVVVVAACMLVSVTCVF